MVLNVYIRAFWHLQFISLIFRFDRSDYENGYSRNLLWRLWHAAKLFRIRHLFQLCSEVGYLYTYVTKVCLQRKTSIVTLESRSALF